MYSRQRSDSFALGIVFFSRHCSEIVPYTCRCVLLYEDLEKSVFVLFSIRDVNLVTDES